GQGRTRTYQWRLGRNGRRPGDVEEARRRGLRGPVRGPRLNASPSPLRGEGWGEGRTEDSLPLPFRGEGWGAGRTEDPLPLPFGGEGWDEGREWGRQPSASDRRQAIFIRCPPGRPIL